MPTQQPDGYLAIPQSTPKGAVLVLHAWWGLNDTIKSFCNRLTKCGFLVFAPDLYHGKIAVTIPEAEKLGRNVDANFAQAKTEIAEATKFLVEYAGKDSRGVAVIGFSLGAYYAVDLAAAAPEHIQAVVLFYGTGDSDLRNSRASFLGHFAENDQYEPIANADSLEKALKNHGRPVNFYRYPNTSHWFFEPDRPQEYNKEAAGLAWSRTLDFLNKQFE